jgi:hypothetical protein
MFKWLKIMDGTIRSSVPNHLGLALENLALRQQLATLKHCWPGLCLDLRPTDLGGVESTLAQLEGYFAHCAARATVIRWHRQEFRYFWRWRSRTREHPKIDAEIRELIRRMSLAKPRCGAPRIHGELLKPGIQISEATVSKLTA